MIMLYSPNNSSLPLNSDVLLLYEMFKIHLSNVGWLLEVSSVSYVFHNKLKVFVKNFVLITVLN